MRAALHRAGAAALSQLLQFPAPASHQRNILCACGHQTRYRELRSKPILTAVGPAETSRPYYLCPDCHNGQFPADVELDIVNTEFSPGVRRMLALVGQQAPFDRGRQQIQLLADLEVTTKNVERTAEGIGQDIAVSEKAEIQRAKQLDLPIVLGKPIPILCVQIDATGIPVVKKKRWAARVRTEIRPAIVTSKWAACSPKLPGMRRAMPSAIPIRPPRSPPLKLPKNLASGSIWKLGSADGAAPQRKS